MTITSENIIPGEHGKTFGTNANSASEVESVKNAILEVEHVEEVNVKDDVFPVEITVYTAEMVPIKDVQQAVISVGFHVIPKTVFN